MPFVATLCFYQLLNIMYMSACSIINTNIELPFQVPSDNEPIPVLLSQMLCGMIVLFCLVGYFISLKCFNIYADCWCHWRCCFLSCSSPNRGIYTSPVVMFLVYFGMLLAFINFQVVKQRMQTRQFASAPDAVRLIVAKEGFKGLYAVCTIFLK